MQKSLLGYGACVVLMLVAAFVFDNHRRQMSPVWSVPYFSGAANYQMGRGWMWDPSEVRRWKDMTPAQREGYHFGRSEHLEPYVYNSDGFIYFVIAARKLFFWQGDMRAVKSLQVLVHILITLGGVALLRGRTKRIVFLIGYGLNPLMFYFATLSYYYFWQVVPTALLAAYLLRRQWRYAAAAPLVGALATLVFFARPSTLAVFVLLLIMMLWRERIAWSAATLAICAALIVAHQQVQDLKNPWHTVYVGIGAYPNSQVQGLSDDNAYSLYERKTGNPLNASIGSDYYRPPVVREYRDITRNEVLHIIREHPFMILRNAVLNTFQSFGFGYVVGHLNLSYLSAAVGFIVALSLAWKRQVLFLAAILANSITFTPYYPPIPAYMYGGYVLVALALVRLIPGNSTVSRAEPSPAEHAALAEAAVA